MELTIPVVLWGKTPPEHPISCMYITSNGKNLVTGCSNGQICTWDIENNSLLPKYIFMGHKSNVMCMLNLDESTMISSSEDGVMAMWYIADGYSTNVMKLQYVHKNMQLVKKKDSRDLLLFCCGYYSDILVLNPYTLEVMFTLNSLVSSNWMSCFHVQKTKTHDIVLGLTVTGTIKRWLLKHEENEELYYESESKKLNCEHAVTLKYDTSQNFILVVCRNQWELYDTNFFTCISTSQTKVKLLGGDFFSSNQIIVWDELGKGYVYKVNNSEKVIQSNTELCFILTTDSYQTFVSCFKNLPNDMKYYIAGDTCGKLKLWKMSINEPEVSPTYESSLHKYWQSSYFNCLQQWNIKSEPSISIFVSELNQIVFGFNNGYIVVVPAVDLMLMNVFHLRNESSKHKLLLGHRGRVNALLYPHQIYTNYDKVYLVSGGTDFAVCLWNIFTGSLIHKFCVHSGEITQLIVPPNNCKSRIQKCICSVASDHSVAILSLAEKKCVILASNHIFPIFSINWRPLDDFIIIECYDGSVYVWEMETGNLDRVLTGINAQEVLEACQELDIINDQYANPVVHFLRGVKSKNVSEIFHAAQRGLSQIQHFILNDKNIDSNKSTLPFMIDDLRCNDVICGHVLYFNVEAIISELYNLSKSQPCAELSKLNKLIEFKALTQVNVFDVSKTVASVIERVKTEAESIQTKFDPKSEKQKKKLKLIINEDSRLDFIVKVSKILLSMLHCWGLNATLDEFCKENGLSKPVMGTFGIISSKGCISVTVPSVDDTPHNVFSLSTSPVLTGNHLCASKALVNTFKNVENREWDCILENNKFLLETDSVQRPKILVLATMYQNECLELRSVIQDLLVKELSIIGTEERYKMLKSWYSYLPNSKTLITTQDKNLDSNVVLFNSNKLEFQILSLIILSIIRTHFNFDSHSADEQIVVNSITKHLSHTLHFILFNLPKHLVYSKIRRMTIDIVGKGFKVFEDTPMHNKTILCLLELSCNIDTFLPATNPNLSSLFDTAYTAHRALLNIAKNNLPEFVSVLLEEINNFKIQSSPNISLEKSKSHLIHIMNDLIQTIDVTDHLIQVIDILLFCVDGSHLKSKNLNEVLPSTVKFTNLHHCVEFHKIAVGLKSGSVAIYETKHFKYNLIKAHKHYVNALKFSPDGKVLCCYSHAENSLSIWAISSAMFGFGSIQVKCLKHFENCCERPENDFGELVWVSNKAVVLMFKNGVEAKFQY